LKFVKIINISPDTSEGYEYIPDTDVGTADSCEESTWHLKNLNISPDTDVGDDDGNDITEHVETVCYKSHRVCCVAH
jgi:hypothetical protein